VKLAMKQIADRRRFPDPRNVLSRISYAKNHGRRQNNCAPKLLIKTDGVPPTFSRHTKNFFTTARH